jgi:hypothetical protein
MPPYRAARQGRSTFQYPVPHVANVGASTLGSCCVHPGGGYGHSREDGAIARVTLSGAERRPALRLCDANTGSTLATRCFMFEGAVGRAVAAVGVGVPSGADAARKRRRGVSAAARRAPSGRHQSFHPGRDGPSARGHRAAPASAPCRWDDPGVTLQQLRDAMRRAGLLTAKQVAAATRNRRPPGGSSQSSANGPASSAGNSDAAQSRQLTEAMRQSGLI